MPEPIRVLHIVGAMNHGGVESWLMAMLRHARRAEIAMDFLVHTTTPAAYDAEIAARGGRILACPSIHHPGYLREFESALRQGGPYDVLHSHVHWFSGLTTTLARLRGVRVRIAHSHCDTGHQEVGSGMLRAAYRVLMRRGMLESATHLLAVSGRAAGSLFGAGWRGLRRASVVYCGLDFERFGAGDPDADRLSARREFGIGPDEIVLGHVGGFRSQKNHAFLTRVAAFATRRDCRVRLLCVGVGPLSEQVRARLEADGVRAILAGARADVPRLLRAMDVFVFPSLFEGLPLAVVEAQAAGLPCVLSTEVTGEVEAVPGLIRWMPLAEGAEAWADTVLDAAARPPRSTAGLEAMRSSPFSIESSFARMRSIYQGN